MPSARISGVLAPVVTPFNDDFTPNHSRFIEHCRWLLSQDCGLAIFGTNSEANSLTVDERLELLSSLIEAGVDPSRMMPGTGSCSLMDSIRLTRHAVNANCAGVLMLPPFYYKNVSDEGLYRYFSELIEAVADPRLKIYLYHIPPIAVVGITPGLVEALLKKYPDTIAGMKDSSGDWNNTQMMIDNFAATGFDVFTGSETFLLQNMQNGGAGCISATANVNPAPIANLFHSWQQTDADEKQARLTKVRETVAQKPMIPALKTVIGHYRNDPAWGLVRPPLVSLTEDQAENLMDDLKTLDFNMPGI